MDLVRQHRANLGDPSEFSLRRQSIPASVPVKLRRECKRCFEVYSSNFAKHAFDCIKRDLFLFPKTKHPGYWYFNKDGYETPREDLQNSNLRDSGE